MNNKNKIKITENNPNLKTILKSIKDEKYINN